MRTSTRFAIILLAIASANCGSNTADDTTTATDPAGNGSNGNADDDGGTAMPGSSGGGSGGAATAGSTGGTDAGTPMAPAITGAEPECTAAFTRVSECYLSQAKCTPMAKMQAGALGTALSMTNCAMFAMQAGGLSGLASQWNATTACDATSITGVFASLDGNKSIKGLCEAAPLTTTECAASCVNFVGCKDSLPEAMNIKMALGDKANCEGSCTNPVNAAVFRCGIMAGTMCTAIQGCFMP